MAARDHLAKILRTHPGVLSDLESKMEFLTGKHAVLEAIDEENAKLVQHVLKKIHCEDHTCTDVWKRLVEYLKDDDHDLFELFERPSGTSPDGMKSLLNFAVELADIGEGWFLKKEKAALMLQKSPPENILAALGYQNVREMLAKEDLRQVFSALRFVESREWMNGVFLKNYETLTPQDFEERRVDVLVLDGKWLEVAEKFVKKKYHNVSHLKELGVIFVIPLKIDTPGETMRVFTLILHYLHEVRFYADLFRRYAGPSTPSTNSGQASSGDTFAQKVVSLIRGDVSEGPLRQPSKGMEWRIVQRYLAKEDENDPRLFEPHVNPEAVHWRKAENDVAKLGARFPQLELDFWKDLDWIGDFFPQDGGEKLVSMNLIDTVMSLVQEKELIKYLYHHQEALWNKIFVSYMGEENLEKLIVENFDRGVISLA